MIKDIHLTEEPKKTRSMNPKKFLLWMFMVSIIMIFASLTSAFIVRQAEGNWMAYELPDLLWYSTIILLLSSVTAQLSYWSARSDNINLVKLYLTLSLLLGIGFLISQVYTWGALVDSKVYFVGNPSGSFLYVIMGVHGFHLVSGLVYLLIILVRTFQFKIHSKNMAHLGFSVSYWHFLDALWVYLFIFLLLNH
ncbi:MAG: cytochrome c oxidase subunit 3 [Bacteroidota bacterium]